MDIKKTVQVIWNRNRGRIVADDRGRQHTAEEVIESAAAEIARELEKGREA